METNINVNPFGETIVKCSICLRKFHKDNLPGHLKYEYETAKVQDVPIQSNTLEIQKSNSNYDGKPVELSSIKEQRKDAESV